MPTAARATPFVTAARKYCDRVVEGKVPACRWVKLACERHVRDLDLYRGKDTPFYFDAKAANRVCDVISHFPHIKGIWAQHRKHIELEPWQAFVLTVPFGWMCTASGTRRFRYTYIEVPRKNAKSTITSALGLYLVACDGEAGALVVSAANTRQQASLVFTDAQNMARREAGFLGKFGVEVLAHTIVVPTTVSKFEAISAEHSNLDGLNLHAALVDELHAHPTRGLWDVLASATGSRAQPMIWAITTAGLNRASVCYDQRSHLIDVLEKRVQDEGYFGVIYSRDDGDDPFDESTWVKANPNYGVSIYPETIRAEAARAQVMPSAQVNFLTKYLNIWVNADTAWLPAGAWDRCADYDLNIEDFAGHTCYIGVDLARRSDITAVVMAFPPAGDRDWWAVFCRFYLPEQTISRSENTHYQGWETDGRLIGTPGVITDFDYIIEDLYQLCSRFAVQEVAFDPHDSAPVVAMLPARGITAPLVEIRQVAPNMSPPMVEMEGLVLSGRIRHDGDPVLAWMVSNVMAHRKGDLMQPTKSSEEKKIDGVTALLMCIYRAMKVGAEVPNFEERGLWSI